MRYTLAIIAACIVFTSCKKSEDRRCFKSVGSETTKEIELGSFESMFLGPHLNYVLVQDTVEKIVITGGKNLVNFIGTEIVDGKLSVTNDNKCNFLRTYKKSVTVEIHLVNVSKIEFEGTKPVLCPNPLTTPNLLVVIKNGAGEFNLKLDNDEFKMKISNGWGNMSISGVTKYAKMEVTSNGFFDSYDLTVLDSLHVISKTSGLSKINADNTLLRSETSFPGDIWYIGTPTLIDHTQYGTGELLNKN